MYRYKKSIGGEPKRQAYIYFASQLYRTWPEWKRETIRELCRKAGGEYWEALLEYVTTETPLEVVCDKHYISKSTLHRITRTYYRIFPKNF